MSIVRTVPILVLWVTAALVLTACGASALPPAPGGVVAVVAGENVWGSIAAQVGGAHARVLSVVSNPNADPHAYEPTARDARAVADAGYVVANGAGYDPWLARLVDADPSSTRLTLTVADLAHRREGDNPHMWYSPPIVRQVARRIAADLGRLDPPDAAYFAGRAGAFLRTGLSRYDALLAAIRAGYHGIPVAATESIVVDLAADLGLDLATPPAYMRAVAEGDDPTPADRASVEASVTSRRVRVLVYNSQNATAEVQAVVDRARAAGIPVVAVTETLSPATASFQDWQSAQLAALQHALASSGAAA